MPAIKFYDDETFLCALCTLLFIAISLIFHVHPHVLRVSKLMKHNSVSDYQSDHLGEKDK